MMRGGEGKGWRADGGGGATWGRAGGATGEGEKWQAAGDGDREGAAVVGLARTAGARKWWLAPGVGWWGEEATVGADNRAEKRWSKVVIGRRSDGRRWQPGVAKLWAAAAANA